MNNQVPWGFPVQFGPKTHFVETAKNFLLSNTSPLYD